MYLWIIARTIESIEFRIPQRTMTPAPVSMREFFDDALPALRHRFLQKAGVDSTLECDVIDAVVSMHQGTVAALLLNIVANAGKHGKANKVKISSAINGSNVHLTIADDGIGFSEDIGRKAFKIGFSGGGSSGLGLADADLRMTMLGGSIVADGHGGLQDKSGGNGANLHSLYLALRSR
jgi:signal transduction histidine kinase